MGFNIESYFDQLQDENVVLFYKGNIDSDVINKVLDFVESKMDERDEKSKLRKKVYNVLVESLQNLYHHVDTTPSGYDSLGADRYGVLLIKKVGEIYQIITGNFIQNERIPKLEQRISRINNSSREEIKELYKFILNHQKISKKGGGGLGLVDIARKTGKKLDYEFVEYDKDHSIFVLNISVGDDI